AQDNSERSSHHRVPSQFSISLRRGWLWGSSSSGMGVKRGFPVDRVFALALLELDSCCGKFPGRDRAGRLDLGTGNRLGGQGAPTRLGRRRCLLLGGRLVENRGRDFHERFELLQVVEVLHSG